MKTKLAIVIVGVVALFLMLGGVFLYQCEDDWCFLLERQKIAAADSFERCVSFGFPVMESYPRQCRAGERLFIEEIQSVEYKNLVRLFEPLPHTRISSPLIIRGEARGNWFFEASFPVRLLDTNGTNIPLNPSHIMTAEEWMTTDFVPFEATLIFIPPAAEAGTLVLEKDNPSGLPEYADTVSIPIRFR